MKLTPEGHESRASNAINHAQQTVGISSPEAQTLIQMAQVHATLAVAAAIERLADVLSQRDDD
ncbi:hypothetical protein ACIHFD_57810 [Nonomuraea sp. NPDC051941]|uniref:hypothetical protein n=1 Tax=Nonomuraea sp. NPDC051941 TaxID=3364373 RepID=UPI0037CAF89F